MNQQSKSIPALDVLIPHYNDPSGLAKSLASIQNQTWFGNMRVVIVDDGSDAAAYAKVAGIVAQSSFNIVLVRSEINRGRPVTRNALLDMIQAPFVAWLDAGDIWYPDKLNHQFKRLFTLIAGGARADQIWVSCHYDWKRVDRRRHTVQQTVEGDQVKNLLAGEKLRAYLWTVLGTRESFLRAGRFDDRLGRLQDLDYFLTFARRGGQIFVPEDAGAQCCYFKEDVGRSAREVGRCFALVFDKHRPAFAVHPRALERTCRTNADFVSARIARFNRQRITQMIFLGRAFLRTPSLFVRRAIGSIAQRVST